VAEVLAMQTIHAMGVSAMADPEGAAEDMTRMVVSHESLRAERDDALALLDRALVALKGKACGHQFDCVCDGDKRAAVLTDPLAQSRLAAINASKEAARD
jgi:hypothetical protein